MASHNSGASAKKSTDRPRTALVLSNEDWNRLQDHLHESSRLQELKNQKLAQQEQKRELSKQMTSNWPKTLASMQKQREKNLIEATQKAEEKKIQEYNKILEDKAKEKEEIIEAAKKIIYQRKESSRIISSGLVLSAILEERQNQVKMIEAQRQRERETIQEETAMRRELAEAYHQEIEKQRHDHGRKMMLNKAILDEQMLDVKQKRQQEIEEKLREKEDIDDIAKELAQQEDDNRKKAAEQKKKLQEEQAQWKALEADYRKRLRQQDEEENQINSIYQAVKDRMDKQREEQEQKLKKEAKERQNAPSVRPKSHREELEHERQLMKKAVEEHLEIQKKETQLKAEKKARLREELQKCEIEARQQAEEDNRRKLELARWEMAQRIALGEKDKAWREAQHQAKLKAQKEVREGLLQQWEEREQKEKEDHLDDMVTWHREQAEENNTLLRYCDEIEKNCKESGRPMYPVLAALARVKKSHGIPQVKRKVAFLQSRVPIRSIAVYDKECASV